MVTEKTASSLNCLLFGMLTGLPEAKRDSDSEAAALLSCEFIPYHNSHPARRFCGWVLYAAPKGYMVGVYRPKQMRSRQRGGTSGWAGKAHQLSVRIKALLAVGVFGCFIYVFLLISFLDLLLHIAWPCVWLDLFIYLFIDFQFSTGVIF